MSKKAIPIGNRNKQIANEKKLSNFLDLMENRISSLSDDALDSVPDR